jgi:hypothetical protein
VRGAGAAARLSSGADAPAGRVFSMFSTSSLTSTAVLPLQEQTLDRPPSTNTFKACEPVTQLAKGAHSSATTWCTTSMLDVGGN